MSEKVTNGSAVAAPKQKKSFAELYSKYGTFAILAAVLVIGTIASPKFMTLDNMVNVLRQNSYLLIIAFGTTFVMVVGCINIAYDMMLALVGCASCLVYVNTGGNMLLTIGISLVLGGILGAVYGALVTYFNLPPFIVGLAISSFCQGMTLLITGGRSIPGTMGTSYGYDQRVEVFGSKGCAINSNDIPSTAVFWGEDGSVSGTAYKVMWDRYTGAFVAEMQAFAKAVMNDEETPVTGMDGLYPVLMAAAAAKSLKEGHPVRIQ